MTKSFDAKLDTMSSEERSKYYDEKAKWVVEYAYQNTPGWRHRLDKAGIRPSQIRGVKDLEKIPVLTKEELIRLQTENPPFGGLAVPGKKWGRIYMSPGPIYEPESAWNIDAYARGFSIQGITAEDIVLITMAYHMVPAGYLTSEAMALLGATSIPSGPGNTEMQLQIMRDAKVTVVIGFASFLESIFSKAEQLGYDIRRDFALRKAIALGEVLTPERRKKLEEYGLDAYSGGYGTAQIPPVSYECEKKQGYHIHDWVILEIVDPATGKSLPRGEIGEVVLTTINESLPWIRLGTGDLSLVTDEPCPCGRTSYRLPRIFGRIGEARKVRGLFLTPEQVERVTSKLPGVSRLQVALTRSSSGRDEITIKVELEEGADEEKLSAAVSEVFTELCTLGVDTVEVLAKGTILGKERIVDGRIFR